MIELIRCGTGQKISIENTEGEKTLLTLLGQHGVAFFAPCGGRGECGRCRVRFAWGAPEPTEKERRLLSADELGKGVRLACVVRVKESCRVLLENDEEQMAVLAGTGDTGVCSEGAPASAGDGVSSCGIAVDVGTTTLAAELFSLEDGRTLATATGVNHQRVYGADVLSRIAAANEGRGELLRESICADLARLTEDLLAQVSLDVRVSHMVIAGNTTMCHLLRGLSCEGLGSAPFEPADNALCETDADTLFGVDGWQMKVTVFPGISAFVGGDIVAGIYAAGLTERRGRCLLLDIGTNGEMALWQEGTLFVTSTAAGPVFEGGNISCGMPGVPGAVCHAAYWGGRFLCETIGEAPPVGICGSGIIDIAAGLVEHHLVDKNGTLKEPWFTQGVPVAEGVRFYQRDIREVQMGKAAIRAGIETLLAAAGSGGDMACEEILLSGGFGYSMQTAKAVRIGMFPASFSGRVTAAGNTSLKGAKRYLLSGEKGREQIGRICARAKEIRLAEQPLFQKLYVEHMLFSDPGGFDRNLSGVYNNGKNSSK